MIEDVHWFAGIDWATQSHSVGLLDAEGRQVARREFAHGGAGLTELCDWLLEKTKAAPGQIAVAIEMPHGPVVEMLLEHGFAVFAINPKQLDRFRDRFTVAGAKDDRRDAHVLADSLRTDRAAFRRLVVDDPTMIELREWSRMADELQQERTRLANRLRQQLWRYYPQATKLTDDVADEWFLALWQKVPTPDRAAKASEKAIARVLSVYRIRRFDAAAALKILRETPLFVAPGTTEAACAHIRSLAARLHLVNRQIKEAHQSLDRLCAELEAEEKSSGQSCGQCDVTILRSWPGIGRINLATLLAEATEPLRRRDYHALRALAGAAPVTRQSGKQRFVVRRLACNRRLQSALHHWSRVAIQRDAASRRRYDALRGRGHGHARALRSVADRLLFALCATLKRKTPYDADHNSTKNSANA
ncbi:IS110 family transposase [Bradyrhizobium sp. CSA207]|uniref:IS110 family transposase n=1 Tax=Bradyrhizobium sp. CSA207 TaxID=2698826 RepID=UPI0023AED70B|nr:IS110 family transposase [Bradyrhizobium sp. CSA207]MDE5447340.1 IS110 family transposase [Bradyrhizobium sp. CSA207]